MLRFVKHRLVATIAVVLAVGAAVYVASPAAQAVPPDPPSGTIAQLQAQIDALQQQLDQQAALLATKQNIINGACTLGQHFSQVNADGTIVCTHDAVHLTFLFDSRHLNPGETGDIFLFCPAGSLVTGGGFRQINVGIIDNHGIVNGWKVTGATNLLGGDFDAFATCAPYAS